MTAEPDTPSEDEIFAYARKHLGPVSESYVRRPDVLVLVRGRLGDGQPLEDAVLGAVHGGIGKSRRVADEFANYFLTDLMQMGKLSMSTSSRLRRFLDTGDLVLSVFGDVWGDLADLEFTSRSSFTSLFAQRMTWKAADRSRQLTTKRRAEDKRVSQTVEEIDLADKNTDSTAQAIRQEQTERLMLVLLRMKDRDRRILTMHWKGESIEAIASELGLSYHAARVARTRAIKQARALATPLDAND